MYLLIFLIAILALRVKGHSLQDRNVLGRGMCSLQITMHVKKNIIKKYIDLLTRTVRKASKCSIRQKQNLNLICFVSIKNQNWEMYCLLLTAFYDPQNNNFWKSRLGQIGHTLPILLQRDGEGCVKITLIVSCLEWLIRLFLFIMVEFEKVQHRLTNDTHFSCHESFPKGQNVQMSKCFIKLSHEMLYHAMVSENPCGLSMCSHPPPRKIGSPVEIAFW